MRRIVAILCLLAITTLNGCFRRESWPRMSASKKLLADEVLLIGRARFDPPKYFLQKNPFLFLSADNGMVEDMGLFFTFDPLRHLDDVNWKETADGWITATPGEPFAFVVPRRTLYLRRLFIPSRADAYSASGPNFTHSTILIDGTQCDQTLRVDIKPQDQVVYLGLLTCQHDEKGSSLQVSDEWNLMEPLMSEHLSSRSFAKRLASPVR